MARTHLGSVMPVGEIGRHQASWATAGIVYGADLITRSGWPYLAAKAHLLSSGHCFGDGMSFGSPLGAPAATQRRIVDICSSLNERSFLNFWMPMVLSICHGGIWRVSTRAAMALTHGRTCS